MAEIYIWAAAGSFCLISFGLSKRLGLLDSVPRDPKARVASFSSDILMVVKDQLIESQIVSCEAVRITYLKDGTPGSLWVEDGAVQCRYGEGQESFPIGDRGHLEFSMEGPEMSVKIFTCESGGAEHVAQVSLRMLPGTA